ncbi:MAG: beta-ketoacyl-[acyl-carrier-protein] synthase family protein [Candidatus Nanoarchaeia archaeon]|nr:beta-ketoacyl-[acyl-carrier-protein] synthase family protein [Candidatus Nanoarchaeia archaeon]MDD5740502.1 beta-ketoacyl-[acyl-carrier-protein] synthase family protein [Candidatus Nanoarchaeia archaeon]
MNREVVITGLGIVTPNGIGIRDFWENIVNGKSFFETLPIVRDRGYGEIKGSEIKDFNLDNYFLQDVNQGKFNKKNYGKVKTDDKSIQFAVLGTRLALENAVLEYNKENNDIDVFMGNAEEPIQSNEQVVKVVIQTVMKKTFEEFNKLVRPFHFFKTKREFVKYKCLLQEDKLEEFITFLNKRFGNLYQFTPPNTIDFKSYAIPAKISSFFNFHGSSICINTACSSGLDAIGQAYYTIKEGRSNTAIAGGSEAPITLQAISCLSNLGVISRTKPKPYCIDRDGFAISEGAGIIVLEEKECALKRNAKIYAKIKGYSQSSDANPQMVMLHPEGEYLKKAIKKTINMSGLNINEIDYINTHGTATKTCDLVETKVIKEVFEEHTNKLNISSTKSMTGHSIGAVGGIEAIISALAVQNNLVPPTINLDNPDPECDLNYTPNKAVERNIRNSLVISMGFGGYNSALVLGDVT